MEFEPKTPSLVVLFMLPQEMYLYHLHNKVPLQEYVLQKFRPVHVQESLPENPRQKDQKTPSPVVSIIVERKKRCQLNLLKKKKRSRTHSIIMT